MGQFSRFTLMAALVFCSALVETAPVSAPGDLVAEVVIPEPANGLFGKAIGYDGSNLFYTEWSGTLLHRIDVPPPGFSMATGHVTFPIWGVPSGIMSIAYDVTRDRFWAVGGDGLSVYLLSKSGVASLRFVINPVTDLPGLCKPKGALWLEGCSAEVKIAYDGSDDTLWYAPDTTKRVYHYRTTAAWFRRANLVSDNPWVDVDVAPNHMDTECGYSQVNGVATGGDSLFFNAGGCALFFQYSKTGMKLASFPIATISPVGDIECDDRSFPVPVIWARDGWTRPSIYAYQRPEPAGCAYGGGTPRLP